MATKKCPKCKQVKDKKDFNRSLSRYDNMAVYCRKCESLKRKERIEKKRNHDLYGII